MNAFRMPDGKLDKVYMRTCAIYRLLRNKHITVEQAKEIANRPIRGAWRQQGWLDNTIAIWVRAKLVG